MIMITTFPAGTDYIIWWSIILKKPLKYNHVLYPEAATEDLKLFMEDYQWLSEIWLTMTGQP